MYHELKSHEKGQTLKQKQQQRFKHNISTANVKTEIETIKQFYYF